MFQVIQDLLLFTAQRDRRTAAYVAVGREGGRHVVRLRLSEPVSFATPPEWGYDLLEHVRERLYQIEGRLEIEPDARHAQRLTIAVPVETTVGEALKEAAD